MSPALFFTLALSSVNPSPSLATAEVVLGEGCKPGLLRAGKHEFVEAQISCDGFLSYALVNEILDGAERAPRERALLALLEDALGRARAPFWRDGAVEVAEHELPRSVLYRGHLLLMLAGFEKVELHDATTLHLYDELAESLVDDFEEADLLPSLGDKIWPADNALAASGLVLHGRQRRDKASAEAGERLSAHLAALRERPRGFPARVHDDGSAAEPLPRGTVLAWTAAFLAMGDHEAAEPFAQALVADFCEEVPFFGGAACREWPRGVERAADAASGPIVRGYGVGATALAIAATNATGQGSWSDALLRLAEKVGLRKVQGDLIRYPLENAILLWGRGLRPW